MVAPAESCGKWLSTCLCTNTLDVVNKVMLVMGLVALGLGLHHFHADHVTWEEGGSLSIESAFEDAEEKWAAIIGGPLAMLAAFVGIRFVNYRSLRVGLAYFLIMVVSLCLQYFLHQQVNNSLQLIVQADKVLNNFQSGLFELFEKTVVKGTLKAFNNGWEDSSCVVKVDGKSPCNAGTVVTCDEPSIWFSAVLKHYKQVDGRYTKEQENVCKYCFQYWTDIEHISETLEAAEVHLGRAEAKMSQGEEADVVFADKVVVVDSQNADLEKGNVFHAFCHITPYLLGHGENHPTMIKKFHMGLMGIQAALAFATIWLLICGPPATQDDEDEQDTMMNTELSEWPAWPPTKRETPRDERLADGEHQGA